jgi:hypothetical protein
MHDTRNPRHDFDYDLILSFADGKPVFRIFELGLMAGGDDVESAYREIVRLKSDFLEKARASDLLDTLPLPGRQAGARDAAAVREPAPTATKSSLQLFLIKLGIVYASIFILIGVAVFAVRPAIHVKSGRAFWSNVGNSLHRAAVSEGMPADAQAQVLADIKVLVARYKPFIDEVRPLFSDPSAQRATDQK